DRRTKGDEAATNIREVFYIIMIKPVPAFLRRNHQCKTAVPCALHSFHRVHLHGDSQTHNLSSLEYGGHIPVSVSTPGANGLIGRVKTRARHWLNVSASCEVQPKSHQSGLLPHSLKIPERSFLPLPLPVL